MNQYFIDIASCMDLALQILNYEQNTTQTSNDDIMKKIDSQTGEILLKLDSDINTQNEMLKEISQKLDLLLSK